MYKQYSSDLLYTGALYTAFFMVQFFDINYLEIIQRYGRTLVDDNDSVLVGQVHDFVGVGVVRGPVGVSADPFNQVVISRI